MVRHVSPSLQRLAAGTCLALAAVATTRSAAAARGVDTGAGEAGLAYRPSWLDRSDRPGLPLLAEYARPWALSLLWGWDGAGRRDVAGLSLGSVGYGVTAWPPAWGESAWGLRWQPGVPRWWGCTACVSGWGLDRGGPVPMWTSWRSDEPSECKRTEVSFLRYGAEADRFMLLACDGSVEADAVDRLSVMARPIGGDRPTLPLPDEPEDLPNGEWVPSIKLVHPRLVWLVQQIANGFPGRTIYIVSGYRPGPHEGMHGDARALDVSVMGVANERVYKLCRKQRDAGCGYYPNHNFVHVDVRPPGSGGSYWIDVSRPGERSEYVDSWPGVEDGVRGRWVATGDR